MDGDVGVDVEEGGGGEGAEAVEAGEDFVEEDGETGPVWGGEYGGLWRGVGRNLRRGSVGGSTGEKE